MLSFAAIECAPAGLYGALTDPAVAREWSGGAVQIDDDGALHIGTDVTGEVVGTERGTALELRWSRAGWARPSRVKLMLAPDHGATLIVVQHHDVPRTPLSRSSGSGRTRSSGRRVCGAPAPNGCPLPERREGRYPRRPKKGTWIGMLYAAVLLARSGTGMLIPILPLLLLEHGVPLAAIGLVVAAAPAGAIVAQYPAGRVIDRSGVRGPVTLGLALGAACVLLLVSAIPWLLLVGVRLLQGAGLSVLGPATRTAVARAEDPAQHGRRFGVLSSLDMAGFVGGPAVGGLLAVTGRSWAVVGVVVLLVAALVAVNLYLRANPTAAAPPKAPEAPEAAGAPEASSGAEPAAVTSDPVVVPGRRRHIVGLVGLTAGGALLFGIYLSAWSLYLHGLGAGDAMIGISFTLFALPFVVVAPFAGRLADRTDPRWLAIGSAIGLAAIACAFPFIGLVLVAVALGAFEGVVTAGGEPAGAKLAAAVGGPGHEGRIFGLIGTVEAASTAIGSGAGAALYAFAVGAPFFVGAATTVAGALVAAVCLRDWSPATALSPRDAAPA